MQENKSAIGYCMSEQVTGLMMLNKIMVRLRTVMSEESTTALIRYSYR